MQVEFVFFQDLNLKVRDPASISPEDESDLMKHCEKIMLLSTKSSNVEDLKLLSSCKHIMSACA